VNHINKERLYIFILTFIHFIHLVDFVVIMPLGPSLMSILNISSAKFASLVSIYNIAGAFTGLLVSIIADKYEKKVLLCLSLLGLGLGTLLCSLATTGDQLLWARFITGFCGGVITPVIFAMVTELVPKKRRGKAMGLVMSGFSLASIIGIPIGLLINDHFGYKFTFITICASILFVTFISWIYLPQLKIPSATLKTKQLISNLIKSFHNKEYQKIFIFTFIVSGTIFMLIPLLAPFAVKNMGVETIDLKYMYLIGGIITIITARIFGVMTDRFGGQNIYIAIILLSIAPIYLYTSSGKISFIYYIIIGSTFMCLISGRMIPMMTLLSHVPSEQDRGQFMGIINSIRALATGLGSMIAGLVVTESKQSGELLNFNYLGLFVIFISLASIYFMLKLFKRDTILTVT
jgi:MFS transporter, DHA1 family, inner membrane transport protein